MELAAVLARRGYRVLYWYGYESLDERGWARVEIARLAPKCGPMVRRHADPVAIRLPGTEWRLGLWRCLGQYDDGGSRHLRSTRRGVRTHQPR